MHVIWNEIGDFELTEQKLVGQTRAIRTNKWLSDLELEQLQRESRSEERKQSQPTCITEERSEATVNEDQEEDTGEQRHKALIERRAEFNEEENQIMEKLVSFSKKVDRVIQHVTLRMETLDQLNNILKAVDNVVAGLVGEK